MSSTFALRPSTHKCEANILKKTLPQWAITLAPFIKWNNNCCSLLHPAFKNKLKADSASLKWVNSEGCLWKASCVKPCPM